MRIRPIGPIQPIRLISEARSFSQERVAKGRARTAEVWRQAVETRTRYEIEYRLRHLRDGHRLVVARGMPVFNEDGSVREWVGMNNDVTARRDAEQALRCSEQRLRAVFDNAALGIVEVDGQDRIFSANAPMHQMLGYQAGELIGKTIEEVTAPEDRELSERMNGEIHSGQRERVDYEKRYLKRDGSRLWVRVVVSPIRDRAGRWLRSVGTVEDISQRKGAEQALERARD